MNWKIFLATKKKFKTTLTVRNENDSYETGWRDKLSRATGVDVGPKKEARSPELCVRSVVHHLVPDHAVDDVEGPGDRRENCVQDCHLQTEKTAPMKTFSGTRVNF